MPSLHFSHPAAHPVQIPSDGEARVRSPPIRPDRRHGGNRAGRGATDGVSPPAQTSKYVVTPRVVDGPWILGPN